jgi:membrane-associated phospholipid phosphatase
MTSTPHHGAPRPWRSRFAWLHPKAYLGAYGLFGVVACIAMMWAFAFIADEVPEASTMVRVDNVLVTWLQTHGTEWGEWVFQIVSWLGAQALLGLAVLTGIVLALRRDWLRVCAIAITMAAGTALSAMLKTIFHRGRPEVATEFITHQTWSFPSGHAMNSLIGYGFLAYLLLERTHDRRARAAIVVVTLLLVGVVGFSRLYLGVHYLSDVIAGFLAGATWLIVCIGGYRFAKSRMA